MIDCIQTFGHEKWPNDLHTVYFMVSAFYGLISVTSILEQFLGLQLRMMVKEVGLIFGGSQNKHYMARFI